MKNNTTLSLLISVFALPPLVAYFMYFTNTMPDARGNKGNLIQPVITVQQSSLEPNLQLNELISSFKGKWTLLMLVGDTCQSLCQKNIYIMRQVYSALGKNNQHVRRVLLLDKQSHPQYQDLLKIFPKMSVIKANQATINSFTSPLKKVVSSLYQRIYIVDPYGRLMMYYSVDLNVEDIFSDLKRLVSILNSGLVTFSKM